MSPVPDLANPPPVDAEMLHEIGRESGMNHRHTVGQSECRRFQYAYRAGGGTRRRSRLRDPATVEIVNEDADCGSPPGQTGANGRHRGGQQRRGNANHDLGPTPPGSQQLQPESQFHCCPPHPRQVLWHVMAETANAHTVDLFVRPESGTGLIALPLRIVRITRQDLDVVSPLGQPRREPGRVGRDSGRLRRIVNPENRDSDRSMGHAIERSLPRARR